MADRDDIATADEDLGLTQRDVVVLEKGGAQDEEGGLAIGLELGPLVRMECVLDRQLSRPNWACSWRRSCSSGASMPIQTKWPGRAAHSPLSSTRISAILRPAL
jgi:hypothetical protein